MPNNQFTILKKNLEIKQLFQKGKFISNSIFVLKYQENYFKQTRYAISVNKKIFRTAVLRNKIKRQIRNIVRNLPSYKNIDILVIVKNLYLEKDFNTINNSFQSLYNKIK